MPDIDFTVGGPGERRMQGLKLTIDDTGYSMWAVDYGLMLPDGLSRQPARIPPRIFERFGAH